MSSRSFRKNVCSWWRGTDLTRYLLSAVEKNDCRDEDVSREIERGGNAVASGESTYGAREAQVCYGPKCVLWFATIFDPEGGEVLVVVDLPVLLAQACKDLWAVLVQGQLVQGEDGGDEG